MSSRSTSRTPPRTSGAGATSRDRIAAARAETERRERRRARSQLLLAALVGLLLVAGAAFWAARGGNDTETPSGDLAAASGLGSEQAPPWPAPANVRERAAMAGLPLGAMGQAEHYHVHLDVLVDGKPVPVPSEIGVDGATGAMSYLHTHTPDGIVHIEAGEKGQPFTLGQLFTQWNVLLSTTRLGSLTATDGNSLAVYQNGTKVPGNPAELRLKPQQQIALVFGPTDQKIDIPSSYNFGPGE